MVGIYKITNLINQKCYIGQSRNIHQRWCAHRTRPFNEQCEDYNKTLYKAIRKYGLKNFSFEVLEECEIEQLNEKESYWINYFNSQKNGYNETLTEYNLAPQKMTSELLNNIIQDLKEDKLTIKEIAEKYNFHSNMITNINQGHSWFDENLTYPIKPIYTKTKYFCILCNKEIISYRAKYCIECGHKVQRKSERPNREELKQLIRTMPFTKIGEQFGVSDNAIRKWCDIEKLPRKATEIKKYSDAEWELI